MTERRANEQQSQLVRKILSESCFYQILGVSKEATEVECKKAYKRIVLEVHPDKNPDPRATDAFKKLSAAYTCLSDPDKKRRYDATGGDTSNMYSSNPQQATRGGFGGGGAYHYEGEVDADEIFRMFFGGFSPFGHAFQEMNQQRRRRQPQQREQRQEPADPRNKLFVMLIQFLPIFLIFLSFSGSFFHTEPEYSFTRTRNYPLERFTDRMNIKYFVPSSFNKQKNELPRFHNTIEEDYIQLVREKCSEERHYMMSLKQRIQYSYTQRMRDEYKRQLEHFHAAWCERLQELSSLA